MRFYYGPAIVHESMKTQKTIMSGGLLRRTDHSRFMVTRICWWSESLIVASCLVMRLCIEN